MDNFKNRKRKKDYDSVSSDSENEVFKISGNWPRWLVVTEQDESRPLSGLSPFAIAKGIKGLSGEPKSIKRLRSGALLVECATHLHSKMLLGSTTLVDRPIKVSVHRSLNSSKGVMRCRDLKGVSEGEIKQELASQGVTDVHRVMVKKGADKVPTNTFFLTFCSVRLPECIKVGFLNVKVTLYVPSPLRCFRCQKFGHVKDKCPGKEVCGTCAKAVHEGKCSSPALCVNCEGGHPSFSKECPQWVMEKKIQTVKAENRIPFFQAKK